MCCITSDRLDRSALPTNQLSALITVVTRVARVSLFTRLATTAANMPAAFVFAGEGLATGNHQEARSMDA
uniref:Uncharacterized protein n=1 Tax=Anopheles albimanus TaxID=7167 RepID=A0A8W7JNQ5_ANOAL